MLNAKVTTRTRKECLILTGATAPFNELVKEALEPKVLETFRKEGFTSIVLQVGKGLQYYEDLPKKEDEFLTIRAFDFKKDGLTADMRACQEKEGVSLEGLVISHAGESSTSIENCSS
jgi:beta-1,4-N-acetylglucosaminyltransferase